ncbi:MAG TPA: diguanylate cyclase, partial [Nitrospiria bacterium]|nr:diguanylate cyclase [Nitrospiria bacterium]
MKPSLSIRYAWYGMILWVTLAPLVILFPWSGSRAKEILLENALNEEAYFNRQAGISLDRRIDHLISQLRSRVVAIEILDSEESVRSFVRKSSGLFPEIQDWAVISPGGDILAYSGTIPDRSLFPEGGLSSYAAKIVFNEGRFIDIQEQKGEGQIIILSLPIETFGQAGSKIIGFLTPEDLLKDIPLRFLPSEVITYIADSGGRLIFSNKKGGEEVKNLKELPPVRAFLEKKGWAENGEYTGLVGKKVYGTMSPLNRFKWGIVTEVPRAALIGPVTEEIEFLGKVHLFIVALFALSGVYLVNRFLKPLSRLTKALDRTSRGEFSLLKTGTRFKETDLLIEEFNRMVTIRGKYEEEIQQSEERYRSLIEQASDGIFITDAEGGVLEVNPRGTELLGFSKEEIMEMKLPDLIPEEDRMRVSRFFKSLDGEKISLIEYQFRKKDGRLLPVEVSARLLSEKRIQAIVRDVSERREAEKAIWNLAYYDHLTGLPNRILLQDRLQLSILMGIRDGNPLALLFLDLDRFKEINDTLGHLSGDILLKEVADRIKGVLRESDTAARLGGDEFAVLLPGSTREGAVMAAQKILRAVEKPVMLRGMTLGVNASLGIALFPDHGEEAQVLIQRADVAMYEAKKLASGYAVYSFGQDINTPVRLARVSELRQSLSGQMLLLYQPKIHLKTGVIEGVEALVRWNHPKQGMIEPDQFIPLAEQTGLIKPLTLFVLEEALKQVGRWRRSGIELPVSVNLSQRSLQDPQFPEMISEIIERSEVPPGWLEFEISENALMADSVGALEKLKRISKLGVRLSIDD